MINDEFDGTPQGTSFGTATERVVFGLPAAEVIVREVEKAGHERVFLTSSRSLSGPDDLPAVVARALGPRFAGIFTDIGPHAPRPAVLAGAAAARTAKADLLISIGGGSVSDATKHMLLCLWHDITSEAELEPHLAQWASLVEPSGMPTDAADRIRMFAVPTLLSAGEFTWFAGITDVDRGVKDVAFHPLFCPATVVLDPDATTATPVPLLQMSGMKAVEHAVGFLCENDPLPIIDAVEGKAWTLLHDALPKLGGPDDGRSVRMDCLLGSWYSLYCVTYGLHGGASHAIGHCLGALGVSHGDTASVVLPAMLRWGVEANAGRQARAAELAGRPGVELATIVEELAHRLGRPTRLRDVEFDRNRLGEVAEKSMKDALIGFSARPITSADDVLEILELAW